jgi:hypothetical protein
MTAADSSPVSQESTNEMPRFKLAMDVHAASMVVVRMIDGAESVISGQVSRISNQRAVTSDR